MPASTPANTPGRIILRIVLFVLAVGAGGSLYKFLVKTPPTFAPATQDAAGTPDCPAPRYVLYPDGKTCKERCPAPTQYSPATGRCEKS